MKRLTLSLCLCVSAGCASTLEAKSVPKASADEGFEPSGSFMSKAGDDGITETVVDATSDDDWHRFDFDSGKSSDADADWDLEFRRFVIRTNGGVNGAGGVEVALLSDTDFASVDAAPSSGFAADREDGPEDENTDPDNSFNSGTDNWYEYNVMKHTLTPKKATYVVHSSEGRYFKLTFDNYYDKAGSPAHIRFHWAEIDPPRS
jgi:hypothetical protein